MSRLKGLFEKKKHRVLNVYCTAGFPGPESTMDVMESLQQAGADIIELGMPYSDPLADGPVIQASGSKALENGMTIEKLFTQLKNFRSRINLPVILMGYMNPVLQYGFEKFCIDASSLGVDGVILPDLPIVEFESEYGPILRKYALDFIFLVTPETDRERIIKLDELSSGFLYAVSSSSTTGNDKDLREQLTYFKTLQELQLKNPVLIGFGIKDKLSFDTACKYARGAIIGSAYIRAIENSSDINRSTHQFLQSVLS